MFHVHEQRKGIKASIGVTGLLWEQDLGGYEGKIIWSGRRKVEAIAAADACPIRAVVVRGWTTEVVHENGKPYGNRITDNRPDKSIRIRAPRNLTAYGLAGETAC